MVNSSTLDPKAWLAKAASDLRMVKKGMHGGDDTLDSAAYHAQQAAEKALKAFLVFHTVNFRKTHDLEYLLTTCAAIDFTFIQFNAYIAVLDDYSMTPRYPDDRFIITRDEAKAAYKKAKTIYEHVIMRSGLVVDFSIGSRRSKQK